MQRGNSELPARRQDLVQNTRQQSPFQPSTHVHSTAHTPYHLSQRTPMAQSRSLVRRQSQTALGSTTSSPCIGQALYTSPVLDQTITANAPQTLLWDPSCLDASNPGLVDIYLFAPSLAQGSGAGGPVHAWIEVPSLTGNLSVQIQPAWWNDTMAGTTTLQLQIVDSGNEIWDTTNPLGPTFSLSYDGKGSTSGTGEAPTTDNISNPHATGTALTGPRLGVAVSLPMLLAVVVVFGWLRFTRYKTIDKRERWSQFVDHRMSQIATPGWNPAFDPLTARGSRPISVATLLNSTPGSAQRKSRPFSSYAFASNRASFGGQSIASAKEGATPGKLGNMRQKRADIVFGSGAAIPPGLDTPSRPESTADEISPSPRKSRFLGEGDRVSRVSFANSVTESRNGGMAPGSFARRGHKQGQKSSPSNLKTFHLVPSPTNSHGRSASTPNTDDRALRDLSPEQDSPSVLQSSEVATKAYDRRTHKPTKSASSSLRHQISGEPAVFVISGDQDLETSPEKKQTSMHEPASPIKANAPRRLQDLMDDDGQEGDLDVTAPSVPRFTHSASNGSIASIQTPDAAMLAYARARPQLSKANSSSTTMRTLFNNPTGVSRAASSASTLPPVRSASRQSSVNDSVDTVTQARASSRNSMNPYRNSMIDQASIYSSAASVLSKPAEPNEDANRTSTFWQAQ
ncbi:uncharacterized protein L969DRAFT_96732 [Mixia osmundae IAM 14324]|uniref:Uncharacterized protein n=1 Tax=Mixia osmundae (strain CBS 9802 / IAM 14324 / JCM 22182 / KY 12970) TaxID=764103 RepID=G7DZI9_MIXOS|nr:uncharacterized protein L969DRAFT_96732 [Mixia osmundae IAM 14324]KEI37171.1 hypothetical protein L969DRAFT_96732 [Mixia osmundae IAM 14324]GAA95999.1 hypothetical protein E5Q_02659 [Mixia osmundae IAM 14324]